MDFYPYINEQSFPRKEPHKKLYYFFWQIDAGDSSIVRTRFCFITTLGPVPDLHWFIISSGDYELPFLSKWWKCPEMLSESTLERLPFPILDLAKTSVPWLLLFYSRDQCHMIRKNLLANRKSKRQITVLGYFWSFWANRESKKRISWRIMLNYYRLKGWKVKNKV